MAGHTFICKLLRRYQQFCVFILVFPFYSHRNEAKLLIFVILALAEDSTLWRTQHGNQVQYDF